MKLTVKIFAIGCLINLILIFFVYMVSKTFLLNNFTNIEIDTAHTDINVVLNYIQRDLSNLNSTNVDYAQWDDTYNYLNNRNSDYIYSNFSDTTSLTRAKVGFILITDRLGNTVYKKNIEDGKKDIFTEGLVKNISLSVSKLLRNNNTKNIMGIAVYDKTPILISAERITKRDGSGKSPGIFVFAKYYDQNEITTINQNTNIETGLVTYDKNLILKVDSVKKDTFVKITNDNFITGYGLLNNIFSEPSLFVKVTLQRNIFRKAENAIYFYLLILLLALILVSISVFILIHVLVSKRIGIINKIIGNVNNSHDLSAIITLKGKDEICELGSKFNSMFNRLKKSDEAIEASEVKIKYLAYHDHLTGLPNRLFLSEQLNHAISLASRMEKMIATMFLDLDDFKMINDTMGHDIGDELLVEVSKRLVNTLRKCDIVARIGGDEFIILIENVENIDYINIISKKIIECFNKPFRLNGQECFVTTSLGIAIYPVDGENAEVLIKNADISMYKAKGSGKNKYVLCTPVMKTTIIETMKMTNFLHRALIRNELELYYQPQVSCTSNEIVGLEALIRWNHPELGMILPGEFIPIAEQTGLIIPIGDWVLRTACKQNKMWQDAGLPRIRIGVNLSAKQFQNDHLVNDVDAIIRETGLDYKYLELEITESAAMKGKGDIVETLKTFRKLGIHIAIDDFGTEYSSLNYLKQLPADRIKIPMTFIRGIDVNTEDSAITKAIIILAKNMGLGVIAEGVETKKQLNFLNQIMCDEIQGFYYFKPMPVNEVEKILRKPLIYNLKTPQ